MQQLAEAFGHPDAAVEALHARGTTLAFMGRLAEARVALESLIALDPVGQDVFRGSLYVMDLRVTSLSMLARLLSMMGHLDEALERATASFALAEQLGHPPCVAYSIVWLGWVCWARGEYAEADRHLVRSIELSKEHSLVLFLAWSRVIRGGALTGLGRAEEGIAEIRKSLDLQNAMGSMLERSYCLTLLAEALGAVGETGEALKLCQQASNFAHRTEGRCYEPETHRVRGELLRSLGCFEEAKAEFGAAISVARQMDCGSLELKAAISDCHLRQKLGESAAGQEVLAEVLERFRDDATSPLVLQARSLAMHSTLG